MQMTPSEIRAMYRGAKYPAQQIAILAQLNQCSTHTIRAILDGLPLPPVKQIKHSKKPRAVDDTRALALYHAGYSDRKIAAEIDVCKASVQQWRTRRGLPANRFLRAGNNKTASDAATSGAAQE